MLGFAVLPKLKRARAEREGDDAREVHARVRDQFPAAVAEVLRAVRAEAAVRVPLDALLPKVLGLNERRHLWGRLCSHEAVGVPLFA